MLSFILELRCVIKLKCFKMVFVLLNGVILLKLCSVTLISPHVPKKPNLQIQFSSIFIGFNLISAKSWPNQISILFIFFNASI
jgi:hypothetical protein